MRQRARPDLWEPRVGNYPGPPDTESRYVAASVFLALPLILALGPPPVPDEPETDPPRHVPSPT